MDNNPKFVSTFIDIYRSFPCLWNVKDESYRNKRFKEDAYGTLLKFYQTTIPSATIDTVKRKINNLKSAFRKELKKTQNEEDNYTPNLWYFDLLMFSAGQKLPENSIDSDGNTQQLNHTYGEDDDLNMPTHSPIPVETSLQSSSPMPSPQAELTPSVSSRCSSVKKRKRTPTLMNEAFSAFRRDDEYDGIGLNVACKLRRMNDEQRIYAESLINEIVLYGVSHRLKRETKLVGLGPTQFENARPSPQSGDT